jgi:hypothetical protein
MDEVHDATGVERPRGEIEALRRRMRRLGSPWPAFFFLKGRGVLGPGLAVPAHH